MPYGFDGGATTTIVGNSTQMTFVMVRAQAKLEEIIHFQRSLRAQASAA